MVSTWTADRMSGDERCSSAGCMEALSISSSFTVHWLRE